MLALASVVGFALVTRLVYSATPDMRLAVALLFGGAMVSSLSIASQIVNQRLRDRFASRAVPPPCDRKRQTQAGFDVDALGRCPHCGGRGSLAETCGRCLHCGSSLHATEPVMARAEAHEGVVRSRLMDTETVADFHARSDFAALARWPRVGAHVVTVVAAALVVTAAFFGLSRL